MQQFHSSKINGVDFTIDVRYNVTGSIGFGAYGMVCSAQDLITMKFVAIKKISNAFQNLKDTKRTLRELKLLKYFKHENILSLLDIMVPPDIVNFNDVYVVTELLETDLHQVISSGQELSEQHVQYFLYQILRGLKHLHSANVLHRDLKPSNILVNSDCLIKICDFGMARVCAPSVTTGNEPMPVPGLMTEYVATRWYRAPEVILSWKQYTKSIDIWSIGCIFAELLGRKALFQGYDYMHQLNRIVEVLGSPSTEDLNAISNVPARGYIQSIGFKPQIQFDKVFPHASPNAWALLYGTLAFNPSKRLTVEQCLGHPYLASLHEPKDEPSAPEPFNFDFEHKDLSKEAYQMLVLNEIFGFHPEIGPLLQQRMQKGGFQQIEKMISPPLH